MVSPQNILVSATAVLALACSSQTITHTNTDAIIEPPETTISTASPSDLETILASVSDDHGVSAINGTLRSFTETDTVIDDGTNTEVTISDAGEVAFSADGNPGFSIIFEDVSSPLTQSESNEPLAYETNEGWSLVPQVLDSHFRGVFVLLNASSPATFGMEVVSDEELVFTLAEDGGVIFEDSIGEEVGGLGAPWAKDAQDRPVPTRFVIDGTRIQQVVETSHLTEQDFPVVADPPVYISSVKKYVINVKRHGNVAKWKFIRQCGADNTGQSCSVAHSYTSTATVQTALGFSTRFVGGQIGITHGASSETRASCSVKGPGRVSLYASANKTTYQVRTVRKHGVPPRIRTSTNTSGTLTAYAPNGGFSCG